MPKAASKRVSKKLSGAKTPPGSTTQKKTTTKTQTKTQTKPRKKSSPGRTSRNVVNIDGRDRRPWALASKERLLEAATEEIAAVGFERARLAEIAQRADMTPGSVYTWFANKEELFRAALESALAAQLHSNITFLESANLDSSAWMMKLALTVPRNAGDSGPTSAQQLLVEAYYASWRDPAAREMLEPRIHEHYAMYRNIVADAQAESSIDKDLDTHLLATLLLAIPLGMALANMAGLDRPDDAAWIEVAGRFDKAMRPVKKR
jgi:AcrR family transcriptional regulator